MSTFTDLATWSADGHWVYSQTQPLGDGENMAVGNPVVITGGAGWPTGLYASAEYLASFDVGIGTNQSICQLSALDGTQRSGGQGWQIGSGPITGKLICDGDSLMNSNGAENGLTEDVFIRQQLDSSWSYSNASVSGQTTLDMITRGAAHVDPQFDPSLICILLALEATNDIYFGATGAQAIAHFQTYFAARKAANPTLPRACYTVMPRADSPPSDFLTNAAIFNTWARGPGIGVDFEFVVDIAADPRLQNPLDTTYFASDHVHWNNVGRTIGGQIAAAAINAYLAPSSNPTLLGAGFFRLLNPFT